MKTPFSYVVLRYMHDVFTREFVNIGVLVHTPERRFLRMRRLNRLTRVRGLFPGLQSDSLQGLLQFFESRCGELETRLRSELPAHSLNAAEIAKQVLTTDDSALQWSTGGGGLTENPEQTLQELFDRFVTWHEEAHLPVRRKDEHVWKPFEDEFRRRNVLQNFQEKVLIVGELRHRFEISWHPIRSYLRLFQPLSFDLIESSDIVEKAVHWSGLVRQLRKADQEFEINLLLGKPNDQSKWLAFEEARSVLNEDVPGRKRLVPEERASEFASEVADEIQSATA